MASPLYNNATLKAAQPGKDFTVDIPADRKKRASAMLTMPGYNGLNDQGQDPVAAAHAFLDKPTIPNSPLDPADEAALASRLDWNKQNNALGTDLAARKETERKGSLRGLTENLATAGKVAGAASVPAMLAGPEAAGLLMAGGSALEVPDQLRRAYLPQADEQRPGVGEAALTGLGLLLPGGGIGKALAEGKAADEGVQAAQLRKTFGVRQATAAPSYTAPAYESGAGGVMSELKPAVNRGQPFDDLMERVTGSGAGAPSPANLDRTRTFGDLNERVTNGGVNGRTAQGPAIKALEELAQPGSQQFQTSQYAKNAPIARATLGDQVMSPAERMQAIKDQLQESLFGTHQPVELGNAPALRSDSNHMQRARAFARAMRTNSPLPERF